MTEVLHQRAAGAPIAWKVAAGLGLAAAIAWIAPFDRAFDTLTLGQPALRAASIIVLGLVGLRAGRAIGLGVEAPAGLKRPLLTPLAVAALVGVGCALTDWLLHGGIAPRVTAGVAAMPLGLRLALYMLRAFNENLIYRLFLASVLIWLFGCVWKAEDGRPAKGAFWAGFALSQAINVWINSTSLGALTPLAVLHDAVRYMIPGLIWSWLYWRRGFQSCEIACTSVHLAYQPLVSLGLF